MRDGEEKLPTAVNMFYNNFVLITLSRPSLFSHWPTGRDKKLIKLTYDFTKILFLKLALSDFNI